MLIKLLLDAVVLKMTNVFSTSIAKQLWDSALAVCEDLEVVCCSEFVVREIFSLFLPGGIDLLFGPI